MVEQISGSLMSYRKAMKRWCEQCQLYHYVNEHQRSLNIFIKQAKIQEDEELLKEIEELTFNQTKRGEKKDYRVINTLPENLKKSSPLRLIH